MKQNVLPDSTRYFHPQGALKAVKMLLIVLFKSELNKFNSLVRIFLSDLIPRLHREFDVLGGFCLLDRALRSCSVKEFTFLLRDSQMKGEKWKIRTIPDHNWFFKNKMKSACVSLLPPLKYSPYLDISFPYFCPMLHIPNRNQMCTPVAGQKHVSYRASIR